MTNIHRSQFQCAFAAMSYFLGQREAELTAGLTEPGLETKALVRRLGHPERARRAEALSRELGRLSLSLEARRLK